MLRDNARFVLPDVLSGDDLIYHARQTVRRVNHEIERAIERAERRRMLREAYPWLRPSPR
jgi:hypothetical protein